MKKNIKYKLLKINLLTQNGCRYFFLNWIFIITMAKIINTIPIHWMNKTLSFNKKKAINTETGSSNEETILPNPIPVCGKPAFNNIGGIIVPNKAKTIPHLVKISKLKGVVCVYKLKPKTITAPPNNIYKLL